jgi:hypothetical protein
VRAARPELVAAWRQVQAPHARAGVDEPTAEAGERRARDRQQHALVDEAALASTMSASYVTDARDWPLAVSVRNGPRGVCSVRWFLDRRR